MSLDRNLYCNSCHKTKIQEINAKAKNTLAISEQIIEMSQVIRNRTIAGRCDSETLTATIPILASITNQNKKRDEEFRRSDVDIDRLTTFVLSQEKEMDVLCERMAQLKERAMSTAKVEPLGIPSERNGEPLAYQYDDVKLYIVPGQEPDFDSLTLGASVSFVQEPTNAYDSDAIYAEANGEKIGYLRKGKLQEMTNDFIRQGRPIMSYVASIDADDEKIELLICYYKENRENRSSLKNSKKVKLSGNTNAEMQENIWLCSEGDGAAIDYDYDKERYLVDCGGPIGFLPEAAGNLIDEESAEEGYEIIVSEITENDNGKYVVYVDINY